MNYKKQVIENNILFRSEPSSEASGEPRGRYIFSIFIFIGGSIMFHVEHLLGYGFQIRLQPFVLHCTHYLHIGRLFVFISAKMQGTMKNNP